MKVKVAILEDDKELLKEITSIFEDTGKVEVVIKDTNSSSFIEKVRLSDVDALVLDIDLAGDSKTGIDVASSLKKPTLFVSGKTRDFIQSIENINIDSDKPIEHITKPITGDKLNKILDKFLFNIKSWVNNQYVYLDFDGNKRNKISQSSIVYMESDTGSSGKSNNKNIYFTNRKCEKLFNFSFTKMNEKGINNGVFVKISGSHRVNSEHIIKYNSSNNTIEVCVFEKGVVQLKVSDNYIKYVKIFKK